MLSGSGWRLRALVAVLAVLHLAFSVWPALFTIRNDFANYYVPARMILEGRALDRLYERDAFQAEVGRAGLLQLASFVPHPPANALLLLPFARLPPGAAKTGWVLLLVLAYASSVLVLRACCPGASGALIALPLLVPSAALANAFAYGQPYPLLLLLLALALLGLLRGRDLPAGLALGTIAALKLYGLPFVLLLLARRRWRAVAGVALGLLLVTAASATAMGWRVHATYLREVLPRSLKGEIQDPYSPLWGSPASLVHRLFQGEADLNPEPALEAPALVAPLARGIAAFLLLLPLAARFAGAPADGLRRSFAALTLAALAAAPLTQSYHFVLLALPVALLLAEGRSRAAAIAILALLAFAASPLPHHFQPLAHGWTNLLAYPRFLAVAALLCFSLEGALDRRRVAACAALAALAGCFAGGPPSEAPGVRVTAAQGYLAAEPVACEDGLAWLAIETGRYVVKRSDGRVLQAEFDVFSPRCVSGRLEAPALTIGAALADDRDTDGQGLVRVDRLGRALIASNGAGPERVVARGTFRRPRLSPEGRRIAVESWEDHSWDIRVFARDGGRSRRAAGGPSNEVEPSWTPDGSALVFASDWRRGLGSTALYRADVR